MTQVTSTDQTHTAGPVVIRMFATPQAGYLVQVRRDGAMVRELCSQHNTESAAVLAWERLVVQYPAPCDAPTPAKLAPAAKGTQTVMSPAEVTAIGEALDSTGHIRRGRGHAAADLRMLQAMARRGFITLTGPQFRPTGGDVTDWGKRAHKEAVADAAALEERAERLAAVLAFDTAA